MAKNESLYPITRRNVLYLHTMSIAHISWGTIQYTVLDSRLARLVVTRATYCYASVLFHITYSLLCKTQTRISDSSRNALSKMLSSASMAIFRTHSSHGNCCSCSQRSAQKLGHGSHRDSDWCNLLSDLSLPYLFLFYSTKIQQFHDIYKQKQNFFVNKPLTLT